MSDVRVGHLEGQITYLKALLILAKPFITGDESEWYCHEDKVEARDALLKAISQAGCDGPSIRTT